MTSIKMTIADAVFALVGSGNLKLTASHDGEARAVQTVLAGIRTCRLNTVSIILRQ
jgi:hypothetical protein